MTEIRFGCGEFVPGTRRIPDRRIQPPPPPISEPVPPVGLPKPPRVPRFPVDEWACYCDGGQSTDGCEPGRRNCLPRNQIPPQAQVTRNFFSKAECENVGFGEEPCALKPWRCQELGLERCPEPFSEFFIQNRECQQCTPRRNLDPICQHLTLGDCQLVCRKDDCPDTTITSIPGDTGGGGRETIWWGCVYSAIPCPEPYQDQIYIETMVCVSASFRGDPVPPYDATSLQECRQRCAVTPTVYPCPVDPPDLYDEGGGGGGGDPDPEETPIVGPDLESITASIIGSVGLPGEHRFIETDIIDVNDAYNSAYIDDGASGGGHVYHKVYNIFNHENLLNNYYEDNYLHRDIFANYIPVEVSYYLKNANTLIEWEDKYVLGLSRDKIIKSLNGKLYQAFNKMVDIDGQPIPLDYFLSTIKRHLISGTIDKFDASYIMRVAEEQSNFNQIKIITSDNEEINRRAALGILSQYGQAVDVDAYSSPQSRIEANRHKFLLTDIEASVDVETTTEDFYTINLEDPGIPVTDVSSTQYVPEGEGGGYYITIETIDGELLPLELNTAVSHAYYAPPAARKLALTILGEDSATTIRVRRSFEESELGVNYDTNYVASALYFKLDLTNITQDDSLDNLVENTRATYVKLTDPDEIREHSKTYGAMATQVNIQFDDPLFQYADKTGAFELNQKDITFRNFNPKRSSGNYSILTRSIPSVIVLNPVDSMEDNIFFVYSLLEGITDNEITRSIRVAPKFVGSLEQQREPILKQTLIYNEEKTYKLGLVESPDTQNVYYVFDKSKYPNSYLVTERSPTGKLFYDLLENTLSTKYNFDYLTWWDIFRRMPMTEFSKFIFSTTDRFMRQLELGFKGYQVKLVLDRDNVIPSVLELKEGQTEDSVILTEEVRRGKSS